MFCVDYVSDMPTESDVANYSWIVHWDQHQPHWE